MEKLAKVTEKGHTLTLKGALVLLLSCPGFPEGQARST